MKNLKAFSRAGAPLPSESRIESTTTTSSHSPHHHRPPPSASISQRRLPSAGALLLSALALLALLALSAPAHAQGFDFFDTPVRVQEGSLETFRVRLTQQPTANVTVIVTTSNSKIKIPGAASPFTTIFTPENWNVYQRVPVAGNPDGDSNDETANVLLSAAGGGYNGVTGSVAVTVLEHDLLDIVSTGDQIMVEGRTTSSITFRLSRQPTANVTVTLGWSEGAYGNPQIAIDTDPSTPGNQNTATFTPSNWNVNRTATLTPIHDADHSHEVGELYLRLPNGTEQHRTFVVFDDDIQVAVLPTSLTIDEGGTGTFTVWMTNPVEEHSQAVLSLTSDNPDVTFSPDQLNFGRSNWTTPQTVTVRAAQDSDSLDDTATIRLRDLYDVQDASVAVSVIDDEAPTVGLTLSADGLSLDEGHSTTFTVRLTAQPGNIRTVSLASGNKDVTVAPATLRFSTSDWNVAQTVTVSAAHDDDGVNDNTAINLTGAKITSASLPVEVIDDDGGIRLELSPSDLTLHEGDSATFAVGLAAQPGSDRTVAVAVATISGLTVSPTSLSFTTSNWASDQTVTVRAAQDADSLDGTATISLTGQGIVSGSVSVRTIDDEDSAVGLTLSPTSLAPNEGMSETFTVRLAAQPANPRTVSLAVSSGSNDVAVSPTTLNFTTSNWSAPQTVTVSTQHDDDGVNDMATVSLSGERITSASLQVEVIDDEADIRLVLTPDELAMDEGASATFTVAMAARPGADRSVSLAAPSGSDVTVAPASLSFTTSNWSTAQTVTVTAGQDADRADDHETIRLSGAKIVGAEVEVTVTDDEDTAVGLTLSPNELTMDEGTSKTFTVRLAAQPGNSRTVILASTNTDVTPSPATLHFTPSSWSTAQTVTVSAAHDDDGVDDTATINLTGGRVTSASVSVSVADDDAAIALTLSDDELLLHEGDTTTLTVRLADRPGRARTVNLAVEGDSNVTVAPATLSFSTTNWNTAQNVTVGAVQDADREDDSSTISLSGEGIITNLVPVSVIDDDDSAVGLTLSATSLTLNEGASTTFTVRLAAQPGNPRTVHLSAPSGSDVTVTPAALSFSTTNWSTAQTVTVRADHDDDGEYEDETIRLSGVRITPGSVEVTVIDDDASVGLNLSADSLTLDEGASTTFTVQLTAQPHSARTVNLSSTNADVTVTPASLDFSTSNWSAAQTVTVSARQDEDAVDDTATINLTGARILANFASVTVIDDDDSTVGLYLSPDSLNLSEGASATFTVRLTSGPRNARIVNLASSNSEVTVSPEALNFSVNNWSTFQTVTVRAGQDSDADDESATINLTGARITSASVPVSVADDDDPAVGLTLSADELTLDEGASATFTVRLAAQPRNSRTVSLSSTNADVTVTPASLDFSTSNWSAAQTVTVSAGQDDDTDDETAKINLFGARITTSEVSVSVADDDAIGLTLSTDRLTLDEGGSKTFTVRLAAQPGGARTVNLASDNTDVTLTPSSLNFSTGNWSAPQTVTVRAAQDVDGADDHAAIRLSGSNIAAHSVSVSVTDDEDTDVGMTLSATSLTLNEGASATFTVRLAAQPKNFRVVSLVSSNDDVTVTPASLSFSTSNWSAAQTVTVRVSQDGDAEDETATINLTGARLTSASVSVSVADDDAEGLTLSTDDLTLDEGGATSFTVRLTDEPGGARTVNLASDNTDVTVTPSSLNFSTSNWSAVQTVTVRAVQDADSADDTATIRLSGSSIAAHSVKVSVTDDEDTAVGLTLSATSLTLNEGASTTFTVRLTAQPGNARVVNLSSSNSDVTVTPATLNFSTGSWSAAQTVRVRAAQDGDTDDETATISLAGARLTSASVSVSVTDDDAVGLTLSVTSLTLDEGASATFTVRLAAQPPGARSVTLASSNTEVTITPATLNFSTGNWSAAQTVTVSAAQDADALDDTATISLTGANITAASLPVTVTDDDDPTSLLSVTTISLEVDEGSSTTFQMALASKPGNPRVVNLTSTNPDVTVKPAVLNFSVENWNVPQTLTISAAQDADDVNDTATINVTGVRIFHGSLSVTVTDDDDNTIGLTLSALSLKLDEGASATFTVRLAAQPDSSRTVIPESTNSDVTFSPTRLTFARSAWSTPQTVTIRAASDADAIDDEATLSLMGSGIVTASTKITVNDTDEDELEFSVSSLTMVEGEQAVIGVKLKTPPIGSSVTVEMSSSNSDMRFDNSSTLSLSFATSNWYAFKYVVVTALADADVADESATISLTSSGGNYDNRTGSIPLTVYDDDYIALTPPALEVTEGQGGSFTVNLAAEPPEKTVVVRATILNPEAHPGFTMDTNETAPGNQSSMSFTAGDWKVPQVVKLATTRDDNAMNSQVDIGFALTTDSGSLQRTVLRVRIVDEDTGPGLDFSVNSLQLLERGSQSKFGVKLRVQPSATVSITVTSDDTSVSVDTDATQPGKQGTLTFTQSNWNDYQQVHVQAAGDSDYSDNTATLTVAASGGGYSGVSRDLPVTVLDEDSLAITPGVLFLTEGAQGSFTVRLDRQPSESITLTLLPSPAGSPGPLAITFDTNSAAAGDQNRLTFTSSNWNVDQTVTVSAIDDTALSGDKSYPLVFFLGDIGEPVNGITQAIWHRLAGKYRRVGFKDVAVYDDEVGREVSTTSLALREGGSATFTVRLTSNIVLDRTFPMQSDNPDVTLSPSSLSFTRTNWSAAQTVTVRAAHDADVLDDSATISMGGTVIPAAQVSVLVTDDEDSSVGLTFSVSELELNEGALASFTVRLSAQPDSSRTLTLASSNPDVTFSPAMLHFSTSTWNTAQTVTVRGGEDADAMDDNALLSFTGTGIVTGSIEVSVADSDDPTVGLTLSATSLTLSEGASATFTVQLAAQPRNDRTVTLVPTDPDVTVVPRTLTFFANNWSVVQTVTVSAAQDEDITDETVTISLTGDRVAPGSVSVTVSDNDLAGSVGLTLSVSALSVGEGSSATFTVQLAAAITDGRTVNLASDNPDVTVDTDAGATGNQTALSFTPANWSAPQTVTVSAAQDADNIEDTATILLSGQRIYEKSLKVTVSDDDAPVQLQLSEDALTLSEGASATFTVQLATQPLSDRTVTLSSDNPDVTLSTAELNFSPSNWNIAQTVRVTAAQDDDSADDTANVNLSGEKIVPDAVEVTVNDDDGGAGLNLSAIAPERAGDAAGRFAVRLAGRPDGLGGSGAVVSVPDGARVERAFDRPDDRPFDRRHRRRPEPARSASIPDALGRPSPGRHS